MKIFKKYCTELEDNGGILKEKYCTRYFKPEYVYHREDGPAIEWHDDDEKAWWYNHKWIMSTEGDVTKEQVLDFRLRIL